ncbi:MAG TPA: NADH-quinone oxidoreductase subunit C [Chthonomonadales bacterium]|nr:NADH-quinone oxidoreductase subunit C [Chthonomonadales bacterium]
MSTALNSERLEVTKLHEKLPGVLVDLYTFRGDTWIVVRRESIVDVCRLMRDDADLQYNFFSECLGVDYLEYRTDYRFEVVYNLYSLKCTINGVEQGRNRRIFLKIQIPEDDPTAPSVVSVYPGANFPEREIFDMFGVRFTGHPDLRRLLMADDWVGHPQRKDYPLGGERVEFPENKKGPSVGEVPVQHPGESFYGKTGDFQGETYGHPRVPTPDRGPGTELPPAGLPGRVDEQK